jgi:DNA replication and repair protein RecF
VVWVRRIDVNDLRVIRRAGLDLAPGLNVFVGANAQGKTTLLEGVGLLARGRSFRTEQTPSLVRRGGGPLLARGAAVSASRETALEVEVSAVGRRLRVDGRDVGPAAYNGRLEVVVYSTDRLRVVRGPMRERRLYVDRNAAALWPAYRQLVRDHERIVQQRNASLESGGRDLDAWDERLAAVGAALRQRRTAYARRLQAGLDAGFRPAGEAYGILAGDGVPRSEGEERERLAREIEDRRRDERRAQRSLVGPHRDAIALTIDGEDAALSASSGQARSLLLALSLAALEVYRQERGEPAVALLDDLDSELDEERTLALCRDVAARGQALVTTAHEGWVRRLDGLGRTFHVTGGQVSCQGVA